MNLKDLTGDKKKFDNSDKTNLLNKILPCDFTYDKASQTVTLDGPMEEVSLVKVEYNTDKTAAIFHFVSNKTGKEVPFTRYINSPYRDGVKDTAILATFIQLRQLVETFLGKSLTDADLDIEVNSFEELIASMVNKVQLPTLPVGYLFVEFKDEESEYVNTRVFNQKGVWISNKKDSIDMELSLKRTLQLIVEEEGEENNDESAPTPTPTPVPTSSNTDDLPF